MSDATRPPIGEDTPYWRTLRAALVLPVEEQFAIAKDLAANCGYELTGDAYTAPPKPAPDEMRPLVLQFTPRELAIVQELAEYHQLSELQTMRQALRFYQLHDKRTRDGETVKWSGDDARAKEFAALAAPVPPADETRKHKCPHCGKFSDVPHDAACGVW